MTTISARKAVRTLAALCLAPVLTAGFGTSATAQTRATSLGPIQDTSIFEELEDGSIVTADKYGTYYFATWNDYVNSDFFEQHGKRCGTDHLILPAQFATTGDCSSGNTNPTAEYDPQGGVLYSIPVVFHILRRNDGTTGDVSDALIQSQIDVLNEDFRAIAGSNGAPGVDTRIEFTLAGITRSNSNSWYNDRGTYYDSLAWDTTRYLNIYTNTAGGNLGYAYVPSGGGVVGNTWDRVVLYWPAVGRPAPYGPPYHLGRSATHEVGHYLGLYHTFQGGCASASGCYQNGDLICDTNPESSANFSPCSRSTCGSLDPTENYMDYSDDICMTGFSSDQAHRMRCTLAAFRVDLSGQPNTDPPGAASAPSPNNGATGVSTSANLSWTAGSGADSHDVYFGGVFQGNQSGTSFDPGTLAADTTYSWRIDEVNSNGTTTGSVWSFTTATEGGGGVTLSANGYKVQGRQRVDLTWGGASGANVEVYFNGNLLTTTANDGAYTHNIGNRGGGSYTYQVRETGGGASSNIVTVTF